MFNDVYAAATAQGLPAETLMSEYAPGQFEITLHHRDDALRAVDEAVMFKRVLRGVAQKHGLIACFMAKPFTERAGSGLHVHVSLNDAQGTNIFASDDPGGHGSQQPASGHRRHEGQHGRVDGGVRAQREFVSPVRQRELRARRADLGHQQSLGVSCACRRARRRRGTSSTASAAPTPICTSRWPRCWAAPRMDCANASIRVRPSKAMATRRRACARCPAAGARRCNLAARVRVPRGNARQGFPQDLPRHQEPGMRALLGRGQRARLRLVPA